MDNKEILRETAMHLVLAVWRQIDHSAMSASRRMGIYDELVSKIRNAALTSDLHRFVDNLCKKFDVRSLRDERVLTILHDSDHKAMLDTLRNETTLLVLMLRVHQEEAAERYEKEQRDTKETLDRTFGIQETQQEMNI